MNFSNAYGTPVDSFTATSDQRFPLGFRAETRDGRAFRYAQVGVSDTVAGDLYQGAAPIPNHLARTAPVVAVGATSFSFSPGATGGAANLYAEGFLQVDTTPGNGFTYAVSGHATITGSVAFTVNLVDPIQVALTASSAVGLIHNPYKNVILPPTTSTGRVCGVAPCVGTATFFQFLQTWGPCSVLINGTPAVTAPVINSATTTGSVDVWTAGAQPTSTLVGYMMQVGVSTKNNFVFLTIAP